MPLARIQTRIVDRLEQLDRLSKEKADALRDTQEEISGDELDRRLREDCGVSEVQLLVAKAHTFNLAPFFCRNFRTSEVTFDKLDKEFCAENKVLPIGYAGEFIIVALSDPFNVQVVHKIQEQTRFKVSALLAQAHEIDAIIEAKESPSMQGAVDFGDVFEALDMQGDLEDLEVTDEGLEDESAPIVQLASRIIEDAYFSGGSDIHLEPFEKQARVRVRIDGVLQEKLTIPPKVAVSLIARLKIMSNLDIAEKRLPQDGRIVYKQYNKKGIDVDLRVATAPLNHGEGCVMRLLDKTKSTLPLPALGFEPDNLTVYRELIQRPYGMILHCGPTGSGKSMTLYSALNEINTSEICIRTAEDPIEYTLPGLCQMQMHRTIGLTFARALRGFLRQDPDVILVGEIRDQETAQIAVEAALTGHLLFSTLHTNDAPSTIARLTDMEIEPFMISSSLICVCAQRLMRRLEKSTKSAYELEGREKEIIKRAIKWTGTAYKANAVKGPNNSGTGYKGRIGIHELMANSEELTKAINDEEETAVLKKIAIVNGMKTLHMDSMLKVKSGLTSMEEAIATVPPDMEDLDTLLDEAARRKAAEQERRDKAAALELNPE